MMADVYPEVIGLNGGAKQLWLRIHYDMVKDYYYKNGPDATMSRFNMRQYTLESFLLAKPVRYENMTEAARAIFKADQALEAARELRHRVNDIETQLEETIPLTQIAYGFLSAVAQAMPAIELQQAREKEDPFSLADFRGKSGK